MARIAKILTMSLGESRNVSGDYTEVLEGGELLTGVPTVIDVDDTGDLVISDIQVNTAETEILGRDVEPFKALMWHVTGGRSGQRYRLRATVSTNAQKPQTFVDDIQLQVV